MDDAEQQILLWEKKVQLAKEMKDTIKPPEGNGEIDQMKAEIHRMKVRYGQVKRQEETLILEMESAIERRGAIANRARVASQATPRQPGGAAATVKKQVSSAQALLKQTQLDAANVAKQAEDAREQQIKLNQKIQTERQALALFQDSLDDRGRLIQAAQQTRNGNLETILYHQDLYKHLVDARTKPKAAAKPSEDIGRKLTEETNTLQKLNNIVDYLAQKGDPLIQTTVEPIQRIVNARLDMISANAQGKAIS